MAGEQPGLGPQLLLLEFVELGVDITAGGNIRQRREALERRRAFMALQLEFPVAVNAFNAR